MTTLHRAFFCLLPTLLVGLNRGEAQEIAPKLQPFVDAHTLAGAVVLVADRERVLDVETVGFADIATGKAMTPNTLFWIASESKPITATALMMLVDEGKVSLDDPVAKFIPEFAAVRMNRGGITPDQPRRPITVRDLLSHTSGLPFSAPIEKPTLDGLPLHDAVQSYTKLPLQSEPGTKYQYSNAGINTVGRIIEIVGGQPYETFLQTRLFDPLGMPDTTFRPTAAQLGRLATSYKPNAAKDNLEPLTIGQLRYPLDGPDRYPMPAGGLFSTAADMAKFARMILNDGTLDGKVYLAPESIQAMTRRQTAPELKDSYGLGWTVNGDGTEIGHGGAFSTNLTINRKRGLIFVWMVQHAGFPKDGERSQSVFRQAAISRFGAAKP